MIHYLTSRPHLYSFPLCRSKRHPNSPELFARRFARLSSLHEPSHFICDLRGLVRCFLPLGDLELSTINVLLMSTNKRPKDDGDSDCESETWLRFILVYLEGLLSAVSLPLDFWIFGEPFELLWEPKARILKKCRYCTCTGLFESVRWLMTASPRVPSTVRTTGTGTCTYLVGYSRTVSYNLGRARWLLALKRGPNDRASSQRRPFNRPWPSPARRYWYSFYCYKKVSGQQGYF